MTQLKCNCNLKHTVPEVIDIVNVLWAVVRLFGGVLKFKNEISGNISN